MWITPGAILGTSGWLDIFDTNVNTAYRNNLYWRG